MKKYLFVILFSIFSVVTFAQQDVIEHAVEEGETLFKIATVYTVSVDSIMDWNELESDMIYPKQVLKINNLNELYDSQIEIKRNQLALKDLEKEYLAENNQELLIEIAKLQEENKTLKNQLELEILESKQDSVLLEREKIEVVHVEKLEEDEINIPEKSIIEGVDKISDVNLDIPLVNKKKKEKVKKEIDDADKTIKAKKEKKIEESVDIQDIKEDKEFNKQNKKDKKEDVLVAKEPIELNSLPTDTIIKKNKKKKKLKDEEVPVEVLVFDMPIDSSKLKKEKKKKEKKENKKIIKEIVDDKDSLEVAASISIDQVEVVDSKKKKKLKIGDEVDETRKEKARFMLSRAKTEIDKGEMKKALGYIEKSISQNPSYADAYMLKADIYASYGHFAEAHNEYIKASQLNPDNAQIHYNVGICLIELNKKDKAISAMTTAIKIDSSYILAYSGRSTLYIEEELYTAAILDYNSILKINKYFYPALKGRGIAYLSNGEYSNAIRDFNQLLEYEPEDGYVYHQRGLAKLYDNDLYGGCMDLLSAVELGETDAEKNISKYCD